MPPQLLRTLSQITVPVVAALAFCYRHRHTIAVILELLPEILRYAADPPPNPNERDVTPHPRLRRRKK